MEPNRTTPCRFCGKPIIFIKTQRGKSMPLDPDPVPFIPDAAGWNIYVTPDGEVIHGCPVTAVDREPGEPGYISHFATCPAGDLARKAHKSDRVRGARA